MQAVQGSALLELWGIITQCGVGCHMETAVYESPCSCKQTSTHAPVGNFYAHVGSLDLTEMKVFLWPTVCTLSRMTRCLYICLSKKTYAWISTPPPWRVLWIGQDKYRETAVGETWCFILFAILMAKHCSSDSPRDDVSGLWILRVPFSWPNLLYLISNGKRGGHGFGWFFSEASDLEVHSLNGANVTGKIGSSRLIKKCGWASIMFHIFLLGRKSLESFRVGRGRKSTPYCVLSMSEITGLRIVPSFLPSSIWLKCLTLNS